MLISTKLLVLIKRIIIILIKRITISSKRIFQILKFSEFLKFTNFSKVLKILKISNFKIDRVLKFDFKHISLEIFKTKNISNNFKNFIDESDKNNFIFDLIIQLILSKNSQLKKRQIRLISKIDIDKYLQFFFDDHFYSKRKIFENVKKNAIKM